ncbi:MAG: hypothetical protein FE048_03695 [Thermoplasmata archaeon]|nr:MAG: hypothetical protein FE048_03695 [Thermoplasmata archaeon]
MTYSIKTITLGSNNISIYSINSNASIASIAEKSIRNYTIEWNGDIIYVIELCPNATAVKLPDNRIGIKFADGETILLPRNSTLTKMNLSSKVTIEVSDWGCLICLSSIDKFSINNLTNISYSQHVDGLHSYNLKINLFGLHSYVDYIAYYWINWGDGNKERVSIPHGHYETIYATTAIPNTGKIETFEDKFSISHRYKKSGTYPIKIGVVDNFGNKYTFATHARIYYEGPLKHTYFVIAEYKEPIATASGSVGFATLLAFILFTEPGKYKFLSFLLIPLYTRIKKEDMLDNFVRGQIYGLIKTNPGIHYNDIMRKLELKKWCIIISLTDVRKNRYDKI